MSGKFWGGASSGSEEEDEDFFSDESDEEVEKEEKQEQQAVSKWKITDKSNDDGDDEDRIKEVRARDDRVNDALNKQAEKLKEAMDRNDWNSIPNEFEELNKLVKRWCVAWDTKTVPPKYIGSIVELEEFHAKCYGSLDYKKGLSKTNLKSLNTMYQKIKKNNSQYTPDIKQFRYKQKQLAEGKITEEDLYAVANLKASTSSVGSTKDVTKSSEATLTAEAVDEELEKLIASRGKKSYDKKANISKLKELLTSSHSTHQTLQIYMHIISGQFDTATIASHLGRDVWKDCLSTMSQVLDVLAKDPKVLTQKKSAAPKVPVIDIKTSLVHFLERLEQEYFKHLQDTDQQKITSYIKRMQDVTSLVDLAKKLQELYTSWNDMASVVKSVIIQMKYQHQLIKLTIKNKDGVLETKEASCEGMATCQPEELEQLVKICFKFGDERQKTHGILYYISYLANKDQYYKAKDLMLMSHLQDTVSSADIDTQILYNRAMVFLGFSAFRLGNILDAHNCLADLCSSSRYKELLAQGTTRYSDKGAEQEKIESRRQMPFHMHINLDVLECVHFVCALLLEVPNSAAYAFDVKRKPISRHLKKYIELTDRQPFIGPPELTRDFVVAAAKALMRADWKKCCDLLFQLKVWKFMPDANRLIEMLTQKIKEEGLRTYLFTASSNYDSLSVDRLISMFELDKKVVHSVVSKMILNGDLHASWDQSSTCIVMHKIDPTRLQSLSLQFAEKAQSLQESNERLFEVRTSYHKHDSNKDRSSQNQGQYARRYNKRYPNQQNQPRQRFNKDGNTYNKDSNYNKDTSTRRSHRGANN